ncbi:MAG: hypothetical protein HQL47_04650 [Gammaproteobacteria bacterium]|nr:hypothetical protein [Gammaproteobacteria bacterium]
MFWLFSSWQAYDYGLSQAGFDSGRASDQLAKLRAEMNILQRERELLKRQVAGLESDKRIQAVVQAELQTALQQQQGERLAAEKKLLFMRGVSSGDLDQALLEVRDLKTWQDQASGNYRLNFTISQAMGKQPAAQGKIKVSLKGEDKNATEVVLAFAKIAQGDWRSRMNFKHFQKVDWQYRLPADFVPVEWLIELEPEDEKISPYQERFAWKAAP